MNKNKSCISFSGCYLTLECPGLKGGLRGQARQHSQEPQGLKQFVKGHWALCRVLVFV